MIEPREVSKIATEYKVSNRQIEKDYVLSWVLLAISRNEILSNALIFKGGTLLKKAYFEDYRFSEDLDFTLFDEGIPNNQIKDEFRKLFDFIREEANMEMMIDERKWTIHEIGSPQFYIDYVGPLKGNMGSRDLKIDITRGEVLETDAERKQIFRAYSDLEVEFKLKCYSLSEVLIEKMTALMGRTEPRDLYDFWYLTEVEGIDVSEHTGHFQSKAKRKNQEPGNFAKKVIGKEAAFKRDWDKKLASQIHDLPKYDDVFREAKRHFKL
jgi:uncharacterized protein